VSVLGFFNLYILFLQLFENNFYVTILCLSLCQIEFYSNLYLKSPYLMLKRVWTLLAINTLLQ